MSRTAFRSCGEQTSRSPLVVNVMFRLSIKLCCCRGSNPSESCGGISYLCRVSDYLTNRISAAPRRSCSSSKKRCSRSHRRDRCSHSSCCQTAEHSGAWDCLPLLSILYDKGRTISTLSPRASIMRKNNPTPGSIVPFSIREM